MRCIPIAVVTFPLIKQAKGPIRRLPGARRPAWKQTRRLNVRGNGRAGTQHLLPENPHFIPTFRERHEQSNGR
jgi:hypothetical protein